MSVAGTYKTTVKSPMGDQSGTLTVVPDGDTFSGSLVGSLGSMDIAGGTIEGNTIKWKMNMVVPMPMTLDCEATIGHPRELTRSRHGFSKAAGVRAPAAFCCVLPSLPQMARPATLPSASGTAW
jgi:hypothetical protein